MDSHFSGHKKYLGFQFLEPLINNMTLKDPKQRPSATAALSQWREIARNLSPSTARCRLSRHSESMPERMVLDTVVAATQGLDRLKKLMHIS